MQLQAFAKKVVLLQQAVSVIAVFVDDYNFFSRTFDLIRSSVQFYDFTTFLLPICEFILDLN